MKIVHTEASCGWGGQEIRILEEASGLIHRGHEVSVVCPQEARIFSESARFGVPAHALPIGRKGLTGFFAMRQWLKQAKPDIVNTHSSTDSWLVGLACQSLTHPPTIIRTRHISAPVSTSGSSRWLYGRSAQHIVTTGESLRETLIETLALPPESVTSIPTGIDSMRFSPGNVREARTALGLDVDFHYIGIVATLRSWKGHLYLLEAFAELGVPSWKLLIIGEGPMRDPIEEKIRDLKLKDKVILVGQKTNPEKWLQALDIFCLPSYANEGVPQAIIQAMMVSLPIVTTPVGAILEAVSDGNTALVVPPKNSTALKNAISCLISDTAFAKQLGVAARKTAINRFSRESMLDKMEIIFTAAKK